MTRPPRQRLPSIATQLGVAVCVVGVVLTAAGGRAWAEDAAAKIAKLNKQALDAFDNLNFDQAKTLLEQALDESAAADLSNDPAAARSHLNLGMLLIAGFQQHDQAVEHFKAALKIQPDIAAPAGLFNPEVQTAFDEVKAKLKTEVETQPPRPVHQSSKPQAKVKTGGEGEAEATAGHGAGEEAEATTESSDAKFMLSLGLGSGLGVAKGHLDANNGSVQDSSWSGGIAPSRLGHIVLGVGYFVSSDLLLSLDGRFQIVTGTTVVKGTAACMTPCSAPSTGMAVLARASWFLTKGPLRPFVSGGLGAGAIRQVVKINVQGAGQTTQMTGCGNNENEPCVDTVTGGPLLLAVGGGVAYQIGSLVLLGSLTANVGVPNVMLNIDALLGLGLRL